MNVYDYQEISTRTLNGLQFSPTEHHVRLMNYVLGLSGEAGEVLSHISLHGKSDGFDDLLTKELGDLLWYVAAVATELNQHMPAPHEGHALVGRKKAAIHISMAASETCEVVKKMIYHGMTLHQIGHKSGQYLQLSEIVTGVACLAHACGVTLESVMVANVEKLKARYPARFVVEEDSDGEFVDMESLVDEVLIALRQFWRKYHYSPTIRELAMMTGAVLVNKGHEMSTSQVRKALARLQVRGDVTIGDKNSPRTIVPQFVHDALDHIDSDERIIVPRDVARAIIDEEAEGLIFVHQMD